jgi:DNA segregation ATPase FtsK/SpoIIIE, S-DNA-T family
MSIDMSARDAVTVSQLMQTVNACLREIARQRARLRDTWQTATQQVSRAQARIQVLDQAMTSRRGVLDEVMRNFSERPDTTRTGSHGISPADPTDWLQTNPNGGWMIKPGVNAQFDAEVNAARQRFIEARRKTFGGGARRAGQEALGRYAARLELMKEAQAVLEAELREAVSARVEAARTARVLADNALAPTVTLAAQAMGRLPATMQPWSSSAWDTWAPGTAIPGVNHVLADMLVPLDDGDLGDNSSFGSSERIPWFLSLHQNLRLEYGVATRERSLTLARSLLLRQLANADPGELQFCFYDPVGLGQSVAELLDLAEYDPAAIGGKVWSTSRDLAARLAELTSHIELVVQKYLRSTYETIDEFNAAAGETAEPYRLLVLFDFPTGLTEETMLQLKSIMQIGPRCGVHTLLLANSTVEAPYGVDANSVAPYVRHITLEANFVEDYRGYPFRLQLSPDRDTFSGPMDARPIIDAIGRTAVSRTESAVTFQKVFALYADFAARAIRTDLSAAAAATQADDETTWWRDNSTRGLLAPIGQKGARDVAILGFDSSDHPGALLVGRPGSGKSTLLHTYVGGLTTLYGPDELELYLIDFKEGVEFKSYAAEALPHARVVAIESDREFGLSVLQSLEAELSRRGELLRSTGGRHAGLQALREASGQTLPRVLLVFDEFQVLFARNDKIGLAAADLLETIIRQGRGFGIHVILGSQSLSGLDALGAHVPQLLPVRILLPATDLDARRVLGDNNDAGQYLTSHGEGILNGAGGAVESNERFTGALLTEQERVERLRRLRSKADREGYTRRPAIFEGNASVPLDTTDPRQFAEELRASGAAPIRLRTGSAMTIGSVADIDLRRQAGANVLAVIRDGESDGMAVSPASGPAFGLLAAALASAALSPATLDVIDFLPVDNGLDETLEPFLNAGRITLRRRRAFGPLVGELAEEVRERVERDDLVRPARIAFLFGIHRARDLDADMGSLDANAEIAEALEQIMRDGPDVGIHVWIWSDTVSGASRRLSSRMLRECGWRIAGKMSADDSVSFIGTEQAADVRERQIVLTNEDRGVATRAISFFTPSPAWLASVLRETSPSTSQEG